LNLHQAIRRNYCNPLTRDNGKLRAQMGRDAIDSVMQLTISESAPSLQINYGGMLRPLTSVTFNPIVVQ
jgi:hypothetical protein